MRVADKMAFEQVKANIGKNRTQMADLQSQAATQKRVTKPSDDPVAANRVLASRVDLSGNRQFKKNLNYAKGFLEYTDQSLGELSDYLVRVKELAINQSNDASANKETRRMASTEVNQIYNQVIQIGNRKLGDRYIFSGFKTTTSPFDSEGNYKGDRGEMLIHVDKDAFLAMNLPGSKVFYGESLLTGVKGGNAVIQATTVDELHKQREETKARGLPKLSDPVPRVLSSGPQKEPEPQEPVELRGPASTVPDMFEQEWEREPADKEGVNLFNVLKDLEISLRVNDKKGIQESLDELDSSINQVVLARAQIGSRATVLDNFQQSLEKSKVNSLVTISQLEDADVFETVSEINKNENTLQATMETSGKLIQKSLMDFLR